MSALIEELKKEHCKILDALNKVKELGVISKEGQDKLLSAKTGLFAHIKREDEQFYPFLRKEAQNNKQLKSILDSFARDMESISKDVLEFFDKYSKGGSGIEFAKDFGRFSGILGVRIRKEENIIYAEYEKLVKNGATS